jgi:opacity protein-like surface antigen
MSRILIASLLALAMVAASQAPAVAQTDEPTHDGLMPVADSKADLAYVLPDADFSGYDSSSSSRSLHSARTGSATSIASPRSAASRTPTWSGSWTA